MIPLFLSLLALPLGIIAGWAHFASLERVAALLAEGRLSAIALQLARLTALGALLFLCVQGGAFVLISGAFGLFIGRALVLRRMR